MGTRRTIVSGDLTELLARTAPSPQQPLDLDAVLHRSRQRTRRRRGGLAAGTAAVLAAAVVAWPGGLPGPVVDDTPIAGEPTADDASTVTPELLSGTVWELVELPDGQAPPARRPGSNEPFLLEFRPGSVSVDIDCNRATGAYRIIRGQLEVLEVAITSMRCGDELEGVGDAILSIAFSPNLEIHGDRLVLRAEAGQLVYQRSDRPASPGGGFSDRGGSSLLGEAGVTWPEQARTLHGSAVTDPCLGEGVEPTIVVAREHLRPDPEPCHDPTPQETFVVAAPLSGVDAELLDLDGPSDPVTVGGTTGTRTVTTHPTGVDTHVYELPELDLYLAVHGPELTPGLVDDLLAGIEPAP
ncbi:META domain-containing protein [Nitriliruptoraceae bacterium ZYF776]|nr:META domain-containing protein [Profundirhabdus halotolerans]